MRNKKTQHIFDVRKYLTRMKLPQSMEFEGSKVINTRRGPSFCSKLFGLQEKNFYFCSNMFETIFISLLLCEL